MRNTGRCGGAIPIRACCGRWWVVRGCGNADQMTPTSVGFGSGSGGGRFRQPLVAPELEESGQQDPVTHGALQRLLAARSSGGGVARRDRPHRVPRGGRRGGTPRPRGHWCGRWSANWRCSTGPSDVSIAAVVDGSTASEWDWLKWLPHHRSSSTTDGRGASAHDSSPRAAGHAYHREAWAGDRRRSSRAGGRGRCRRA